MFIGKDSLIIDGVSMGQYLVQVEYMYPKYWGKDTGRNLRGSFSGTLLGVFPKLVLQFRSLSQQELEVIAPILDKQQQTVTYYDPSTKNYKTIHTYSGDWSVVNKGINQNEGFQVSFIAEDRRS